VVNAPDDFVVIRQPYLMVSNGSYAIDDEGRAMFDRSWHHDLVRHLDYLAGFTLAAPLRPMPADTAELVPLGPADRKRIKIVPLPSQASRLRALIQLPATIRAIWRAVGQAKIVHVGMAGWPYPLGWVASAAARLRRKKLLVIVESTWWRIPESATAAPSLRKRIEAAIYERMARHWCARADLSFYTQPAYLEQFHRGGRGPAYVAPATWVNSEDVLDDAEAERLWDGKMREPVRFLFAGRFMAEKGVRVLLQAAAKLAAKGAHGALHIIGDGSLRGDVIAAQRDGAFSVKYFEPIPYGAVFLSFLQQYHMIVVPSLSYEQPRVVFDAAARAVPILASDTDGLRPHVQDSRTGRLVAPGDADALANAMAAVIDDPAVLRGFAMEILSNVRGKTHRAMHVERSRIIARHFGAS
jgi:glycosyltransferase involved in cell wall biosynthesis